MNKHQRMTAFVKALGASPESSHDPGYEAYFQCFNEGRYYEAHDVLEQLWLRGGRTDPQHAFYKGLIQVAGAFVHLRKQHEHPGHPKHGRRLNPARRLFLLAEANLGRYGARHLALDVAAVRRLCKDYAQLLGVPDAASNPWSPESLPQLKLLPSA